MVEQIVIVAFGPTRVTRAALRRARQLAGMRGRVVLVAALPTGRPVLSATQGEPGVVTISEQGPAGIAAAFAACDAGPVLMVHDDVLVPADSARRMFETWRRHGGYVVPWTNDMDVDHCLGALPPIAQAAGHLGPAVQSVRRREGFVYNVRPACMLGARDDLAELVPLQLHNPLTIFKDIDSSYRAAAGAVAVHDGDCRHGLAPPEGPDGRPLLVAHLIVRNEEAMLPDCLASLQGIVDRIEVCDTGSTDGTIDIARHFGAHIIEREWRDDFGWARNEALDQCRDAWYALCIDADERAVCPDPVLTRRMLATFAGEVFGYDLRVRNRNVGGDRDVVDFWDIRVFQPEGIAWFGALHEKPRFVDRPELRLRGNRLTTLDLDHLGYATEVVSGRDKQTRNLEIAEASYRRDPSGYSAFELARALVYAQREPERSLELFEEALTYDNLGTDLHAFALGCAARLLGSSGRMEEGFARAAEALEIWPTLDQPAEAFALLSEGLGRHAELVAAVRRIREAAPLDPVFSDEDGIADIMSRFAAALAHTGELEAARVEALDLLRSKPRRFQHWDVLVRAAADVHAGPELAAWLAPLVELAAGPDFVAALSAVMSPAELTAFLGRYLADGGEEPAAAVAALTSAMVAHDWDAFRALLVYGRLAEVQAVVNLCERLTAQGFAGVAADLRAAAGGGSPAAIEATDARHTPRGATLADLGPAALVLDAVPSVADLVGLVAGLDPADAVIVHVPGSDPTAAMAALSAAGLAVEHSVREYQPAGTADDHGYAWLVLARPVWTEATVARADALLTDPGRDPRDLRRSAVFVVGQAGRELAVGLRASLPAAVDLRFVNATELGALGDDEPVLVVDADLVPEPRWVQALWAEHQRRGAPVGLRVIDPDGRVVHAGAASDGRPFGAGAEWGHAPIFTVARDGAHLLAPFVASAATLRAAAADGVVTGAYIGHVAAVSRHAAPEVAVSAPALRDVFGETVLLLGERSPADLDDTARSQLWEALAALRDAGFQPVYRWEAVGTPHGRSDLVAWERGGFLLFGGDPHTDAPNRRAWALLVPTPGALVGAFGPVAVVHLGTHSLEHDFAACSIVDLAPVSAYAGPVPSEPALLDRVEVVAETVGAGLVEAVVARHRAGRTTRPQAIARFSPPASPRPGTVSVVIPVWNQWRLTKRCMASLAEHAEAPLEIVVVDNGSTDETRRELAGRSDLVVVTNERNLGFPKAVNQGVAAASGEYICVLNNDTEVTPGWLREMLAALARPGTGMVGPRSNSISGLQVVPGAPALSDGPAAHRWADIWAHAHRGLSWPVSRLVGFCLLARRDLFEVVGGFDEGFGIGNYEDDELGQRMMAAGWALRVADGSVVLHYGGATFRQLGLDYATLMAQAGRRFTGAEQTSGLLHGVVLGDGDASGAAISARSLLGVADAVTVLERRGAPATELLVSSATTGRAHVVPVDWTDPDAAAVAIVALAEQAVVVLGAGERLAVREWGRARAEVEHLLAAGMSAVEMRLGDRHEVRLHRRSVEAVAAMGGEAPDRFEHAWVLEPAAETDIPSEDGPAHGDAGALASVEDLPGRPTSVVAGH